MSNSFFVANCYTYIKHRYLKQIKTLVMEAISVKELMLVNKSAMAKEINAKVNAYFSQKKISKKGNRALFIKTIFFLAGFWLTWWLLIYTDLSVFWKIPLCFVGAFFASGIGFCIMHDGNHGAFSKSKIKNMLAGATSEFLGVSSGIWKKKHNVAHHDGVNVLGVDEDIEAWPLLRLHEGQKRCSVHKFQHWYWPIAYSLLYFIWPLKDFTKYFSGRVMGEPLRFKISDHVLFWAGKIFFAFVFFWLPIRELGFNAWLVGFLIFGGFLGLLLSIVFQPAHVVRGVKNSIVEEARGGDSMEHQIEHTANFATNNKFITWWVGALNFQIEHHVFRRISHVHLPDIHKIVAEECKRFDFKIVVFPTFFDAISSHVGKLKDLGQKPK